MKVLRICAVALLVACGSGETGLTDPPSSGNPPPATPTLTTLEILLNNTQVEEQKTTTATVRGRDQNGALIQTGFVAWASNAPAIATVYAGEITAHAPGQALITAAAGSVSTSITITVTARPAPELHSVVVTLTNSSIMERKTTTAIIKGTDQYGQPFTINAATWTSIDPLIATVNSSGIVTGITPGATQIIGSANGRTASATINVTPFAILNGVSLVGSQTPAGTYRSINSVSASCYWSRLSNLTGSNNIIANNLGGGPRYVTIDPTDVAFESSGCAPWTAVSGPLRDNPGLGFSEGMYMVGADVTPGTWQSTNPNGNCYWARLSGFGGGSEVIANHYGEGIALVQILSTDVGFETTSGCGTWVRIG